MFKPSVNGTYAWLTKLFKGTPPRHVVETLFLTRQPQACSAENGQNFVSATYCMKFNWFEFVCHEAGRDKVISIFSGAPACKLSALRHSNEPISTGCTSLRAVLAHCSCSSCVYTRRTLPRLLVPASCLLMCPTLNYLEPVCFSFNEAKGCAIPKVKQRLTEQSGLVFINLKVTIFSGIYRLL